jgi:hypothetical protein
MDIINHLLGEKVSYFITSVEVHFLDYVHRVYFRQQDMLFPTLPVFPRRWLWTFFKIYPDYLMFSFGFFSGVKSLIAKNSEHSVCFVPARL